MMVRSHTEKRVGVAGEGGALPRDHRQEPRPLRHADAGRAGAPPPRAHTASKGRVVPTPPPGAVQAAHDGRPRRMERREPRALRGRRRPLRRLVLPGGRQDGQRAAAAHPAQAAGHRAGQVVPGAHRRRAAAARAHAASTCQVLDFAGTRATVRGSDGSVLTYSSSPYPAMLERFTAAQVGAPAVVVVACRCEAGREPVHSRGGRNDSTGAAQ